MITAEEWKEYHQRIKTEEREKLLTESKKYLIKNYGDYFLNLIKAKTEDEINEKIGEYGKEINQWTPSQFNAPDSRPWKPYWMTTISKILDHKLLWHYGYSDYSEKNTFGDHVSYLIKIMCEVMATIIPDRVLGSFVRRIESQKEKIINQMNKYKETNKDPPQFQLINGNVFIKGSYYRTYDKLTDVDVFLRTTFKENITLIKIATFFVLYYLNNNNKFDISCEDLEKKYEDDSLGTWTDKFDQINHTPMYYMKNSDSYFEFKNQVLNYCRYEDIIKKIHLMEYYSSQKSVSKRLFDSDDSDSDSDSSYYDNSSDSD